MKTNIIIKGDCIEEMPQKKKKITVEQIFMALGIGLLATVILIILLETIVRVFI